MEQSVAWEIVENYLTAHQQRDVLNVQSSSWQKLLGIALSGKTFAHYTSCLSKIDTKRCSNFQPNKDLKTIYKLAFQWKM